MKSYPYECCRCGFCCLAETCPIGQKFFMIKKHEPCPALSFDQNMLASCQLVQHNMIPIGDGCCIKARAYKDGVEYDFAALPKEIKYRAVKDMRKRNAA